MTHERDQARITETTKTVDDDAQRVGRATRTDALIGPHGRRPSLLVMRRRDGNGVAADADDKLASASRSVGESLPQPIQRRFEASLGVDLSAVRVHVGGASMTAAHAVGAKAFAIGRDIHFGAGQYDPASPAGQHLLAHEVAHTVQQRGGSPVRQNRLEVSSPHDAAEHEADRAADAMVAGTSVQIATRGAAVSRVPDEYTAVADAAAAKELQADTPRVDPVLAIGAVNDTNSAQAAIVMIDNCSSDLNKAMAVGAAQPADIQANNHTKAQLLDYIAALGGETVAFSSFDALYKRVNMDYARLDAMAQHAGAGITDGNLSEKQQHPRETDVVNANTGKEIADDNADSVAGQNGAVGTMGASANADHNSALDGLRKSVAGEKVLLDGQAQKVVSTANATTNQVQTINAATDDVIGVTSRARSASLRAQLQQAQDRVQTNREILDRVCRAAATIIKAADEPELAGTELVAGFVEQVGPMIDLPGVTSLTAEEVNHGKEADIEADRAATSDYLRVRAQYVGAINGLAQLAQQLVSDVRLLDGHKETYKGALEALGRQLDADAAQRPGAPRQNPDAVGPYQAIATFVSEADAFLADATAAVNFGRGQADSTNTTVGVSAAALAGRARHTPDGNLVDLQHMAIKWARQTPAGWVVETSAFSIANAGNGDAKSDAEQGNATVLAACDAMDKFIVEIQGYRTRLSAALGT
jgi:hypothetical protein